jgi:glycosyltransferase involved in cell wall biosynthesis
MQTSAGKAAFRAKYDIPKEAVVIGSFQKDGEGWGEGNSPKLLKGPDVLLQVIAMLKPRVPEIFVLLSGPARGFVKNGLEKLGVPYRHIYVENYPQVSELYRAIDVYVVCSRLEGGPKAVLESMASGVPLVTTRVGQAADMVQHRKNGWLVEVDDAEGLAEGVLWFLEEQAPAQAVITCGRETACLNSYEQQLSMWQKFFTDFVQIPR